MPAIPRVQLGASTGNRKWYLDVDTAGSTIGGLNGTADPTTDVITLPAGHGLYNGDQVTFTKAVTGLTTGTPYYVINATATSIKVSTTSGGAAADFTGTGAVTLAKATSGVNWIGVFGITEFTPGAIDANLEDDSDFDSGGFGSMTKTKESWSLELTVARKTLVTASTAYDPGQEFLRLKSFGTFGGANSVHIRWYEMEDNGPRIEAYEGLAAVVWKPNGGAMQALSSAAVTLSGQGRLRPITHPTAS